MITAPPRPTISRTSSPGMASADTPFSSRTVNRDPGAGEVGDATASVTRRFTADLSTR